MNKYKEYLEKAHENYLNSSIEDLCDFNKISKEHLKKLKELKDSDYNFSIVDEKDKECAVIYLNYKNRDEIIDLMIEAVEQDINEVRALIYEKVEDGELFD